VAELIRSYPRKLVVEAARTVVAQARRTDPDELERFPWESRIAEVVASAARPSLRQVINASGVVLHTNLGRAPLAPSAIEAMSRVARGYSNLEFDLASGVRGSRLDHCRDLLAGICGAGDSLVVNNAAGALVLALNTISAGRETLLSRGELIEIGGSFRIPDIIRRSGARLREVGTSNRTHHDDYRAAISERTGALLTVHRSNFRISGFVASADPAELAQLAAAAGVPYIHDVGSGLLLDLAPWGLTGEPLVRDAVAAGADLVIFSGDKLLGGPQAGCMVGRPDLIESIRRNPLSRALRADKFTLAALAATLSLYHDDVSALSAIPVLAMLTADPERLEARARDIAGRCPAVLAAEVVAGNSAVGGGSFPGCSLPTHLVALTPPTGADEFAARLRAADRPVVTRVADGRVLLDPRTIMEQDLEALLEALAQSSR